MSAIDEIRKQLENEKLLIGSERTIKALRKDEIEKIWLAKNPKPEVKEEIEHFKELQGTKVETLDVTNEELGVLCKKQHSISVIGLKK